MSNKANIPNLTFILPPPPTDAERDEQMYRRRSVLFQMQHRIDEDCEEAVYKAVAAACSQAATDITKKPSL